MLDKKKNILRVAGFQQDEIDKVGIEELFSQRFKAQIINLETGKPMVEEDLTEEFKKVMKVTSLEEAVAKYDQIKASKSKNPSLCDPFDSKKDDIAGIKQREKFSHVYLLLDESGNSVEQYVLPVRGYGLWSTLKGYLAVKPDFQTIVGLTYYEHAETPGLGGEVDNDLWKAKWPDKQIYDSDGEVKIRVVKGIAGEDPYGVDGLSGATITSNGVTNMLKYWLGPKGFGPYFKEQNTGSSSASIQRSGGSNG